MFESCSLHGSNRVDELLHLLNLLPCDITCCKSEVHSPPGLVSSTLDRSKTEPYIYMMGCLFYVSTPPIPVMAPLVGKALDKVTPLVVGQ